MLDYLFFVLYVALNLDNGQRLAEFDGLHLQQIKEVTAYIEQKDFFTPGWQNRSHDMFYISIDLHACSPPPASSQRKW